MNITPQLVLFCLIGAAAVGLLFWFLGHLGYLNGYSKAVEVLTKDHKNKLKLEGERSRKLGQQEANASVEKLKKELEALRADYKAASTENSRLVNDNEILSRTLEGLQNDLQESENYERYYIELQDQFQKLKQENVTLSAKHLAEYEKLTNQIEINEKLRSRIKEVEISRDNYDNLSRAHENLMYDNMLLKGDVEKLEAKLVEVEKVAVANVTRKIIKDLESSLTEGEVA